MRVLCINLTSLTCRKNRLEHEIKIRAVRDFPASMGRRRSGNFRAKTPMDFRYSSALLYFFAKQFSVQGWNSAVMSATTTESPSSPLWPPRPHPRWREGFPSNFLNDDVYFCGDSIKLALFVRTCTSRLTVHKPNRSDEAGSKGTVTRSFCVRVVVCDAFFLFLIEQLPVGDPVELAQNLLYRKEERSL